MIRAGRVRRDAAPRRFALAAALWIAVVASIAFGPRLLEAVHSFAASDRFSLTRVAVRGANRLDAAAIVAWLEPTAGARLVDLDLGALRARLREHPWLRDAVVVAWPPDTLLVGVDERIPVAVTPVGDARTLHLVDSDGAVFAPAPEPLVGRLPQVETGGAAQPAERLRARLELAARVVAAGLPRPERISDGARGLELGLAGLAPSVLLPARDPGRALPALARVLADVPGAEASRRIDLRFRGRAILAGLDPGLLVSAAAEQMPAATREAAADAAASPIGVVEETGATASKGG